LLQTSLEWAPKTRKSAARFGLGAEFKGTWPRNCFAEGNKDLDAGRLEQAGGFVGVQTEPTNISGLRELKKKGHSGVNQYTDKL